MSFQLIPQAYAASSQSCWSQTNMTSEGVATITGIQCIIQNILSPLPGLIALAAVFMIVFSGARIITAGSDAKALASAWSTFSFAVIGLILLSVVWLILVLIEKFTGAPVTQFGV